MSIASPAWFQYGARVDPVMVQAFDRRVSDTFIGTRVVSYVDGDLVGRLGRDEAGNWIGAERRTDGCFSH